MNEIIEKKEIKLDDINLNEKNIEKNDDSKIIDKSDSKKFVKSTKKPSFNKKQSLTPPGFEEKVVQVKRISKTTKGGRSMRFSVLVVIGNKKGQIGFGMGKSIEVPDAIQKAIKNAASNIFDVKITKNGTLFHENIGKHGAGKVLIKPAPRGTGIIAGGAVRAVVELAGYHDIYTKSQGSNTPINVIRATINGLTSQLTPSDVQKLRSK
jgi:small subunit ribosomal protein S5